jgi:RNA polymerase sigma factor (sigma-70 family)
MFLRTRQRRREEFDVDADLIDQHANATSRPDAIYERNRLARRVTAELAGLADPARAILQMRVIEDLDTSTVAGRLGITHATVKTRLHRARSELRGRLGDR